MSPFTVTLQSMSKSCLLTNGAVKPLDCNRRIRENMTSENVQKLCSFYWATVYNSGRQHWNECEYAV